LAGIVLKKILTINMAETPAKRFIRIRIEGGWFLGVRIRDLGLLELFVRPEVGLAIEESPVPWPGIKKLVLWFENGGYTDEGAC